jgi:RNA-directed DNA polymerase
LPTLTASPTFSPSASFRAQIVTYADDFVILSRGKAKEALEWTRGVLERLALTLNEKKTSVRNARRERFDFLGYSVLQKCTDKEVALT